MAAHARSKVLDKVASLLSFTNVVVTQMFQIPRLQSAPTVMIGWTSESVDHPSAMGSPLRQERSLSVSVELVRQAKTTDNIDALVDSDAEQLERELSDGRLSSFVDSWRLVNVDKSVDSSGEQPVIRLAYLFTAVYRTRADAPGTIL